jgi:hypothetical protein
VLFIASLQIVLYAHKPLSELTSPTTAVFRFFVKRFGGLLYHAESMRSVRKFSAKYADVLPTLCASKKLIALPEYQLFHGTGLEDVLPPVFDTGSYGEFSWLQFQLPSALGSDPAAVLSLVEDVAVMFPYRCGHVGFSLCWNRWSVARSAEVPPLIGPLFLRYPGFSVGTPEEVCDHPLPPINWLTLLGPELLQKLDGIGAVRTHLADKAISVTPLGAGVCIRAGDAPQLGDINRKDDLPLYRKVGSYLKVLRGKERVELYGLDEDESEAWLARFDA